MDSRTAFLHDMWLRGVFKKPRTGNDSCPLAHPVLLPQFVTLLQPHECVSSERLWRETGWEHHKPRLEGLGKRAGTLIANAIPGEVQCCQCLVLLVMFHVVIKSWSLIAQRARYRERSRSVK